MVKFYTCITHIQTTKAIATTTEFVQAQQTITGVIFPGAVQSKLRGQWTQVQHSSMMYRLLEPGKEGDGQKTIEHIPLPQPPLHISQVHPTPILLHLHREWQ